MTMFEFAETRFAAAGIRSLAWDGDELVDWVSGGHRYSLDGVAQHSNRAYAFSFDAAVALADSPFAVVYVSNGTKGLVLQDGEVHRELNRSYYFAEDYEYPIALFRLPDGRPVLAHCPNEYNVLQIEDLESGEPLTLRSGETTDYFFSRLMASADGRYLASAGWVWHPADVVTAFDVGVSLRAPAHLDGLGLIQGISANESGATFLDCDRMAVALWDVDPADEDSPQARSEVTIVHLPSGERLSTTRVPGRMGQITRVDEHHVLALHGHPRLIDTRDGRVVRAWPHIASGNRTTSIFGQTSGNPQMAFDSSRGRFAFGDATGVTVITIALG